MALSAEAPALDARFQLQVGGFHLHAEVRLVGGVLVLFGPSGAGKSLTLQALAGLVRPTTGHIRVRGRTLLDTAAGVHVPAHRRQVGYVPQHHALLPFHDVVGNVTFGLPRGERRGLSPRVGALLEELGLVHLARARPAQLSGGERQRVALARALAVQPQLLLLDEPFASIDAAGRRELRGVLRATLARHGLPAVLVTHDAEEALALGDSLVRFERGRTAASGPPALLLPGAQGVQLEGIADGAAQPVGEGTVELALQRVRVRGAAPLLQPAEDGAVRLRLRPVDED